MFFQMPSEETFRNNEKRIKELKIQSDALIEQFEELYNENDIVPEKMLAYFEDRNNFTEEEWELLELLKKQEDKKFEAIKNNMVNPLETKKKYQERPLNPSWLFVR